MTRDRGPNIPEADVPDLLDAIARSDDDRRRDLMTRLAWRPAWAIRSRRGAIATLREMFGRRDAG
ncbi:MAG: hypothetical protein NXI19_07630 [Alphaproteobacteria bacterium]|nr:hypothetical protein [Alphaproteobacteria bacterium]